MASTGSASAYEGVQLQQQHSQLQAQTPILMAAMMAAAHSHGGALDCLLAQRRNFGRMERTQNPGGVGESVSLRRRTLQQPWRRRN